MFFNFAVAHMKMFFAFVVIIYASTAMFITGLINGSALESYFFPVNDDWTVTAVHIDGENLIITGTVRVLRQCQYRPPPVAKTETGDSLPVVSKSQAQGARWIVGETYKFGPWIVYGGANNIVTFSQAHTCHLGWDTITHLGVFDATNLTEIAK